MEQIDIHDHLCLIYRNQEEELAAGIPFIAAGLRLNDQCVYITEESLISDVLSAMKRSKIDVEGAIATGQLIMLADQDSYLRDGVHDPDSTINFFTQASNDSQANGFRALRGVGEMAWSLSGARGSERLIEYEAKLNYFFTNHRAMAICQYNLEWFSAETIRDVLCTHPKVIINNLLCENVYYKSPEELLLVGTLMQADKAAIEVDRMLNHVYDLQRHKLELEHKVWNLEREVATLQARVSADE